MRVTILIDKFPRTPMNERPADRKRREDEVPQDTATFPWPRGRQPDRPGNEAGDTFEPYPVTH
jgi:hypothetical protein